MSGIDRFTFKDKQVLVTGGSGFLGRALVQMLLWSDAQVWSADNGSRWGVAKRPLISHKNLCYVNFDVRRDYNLASVGPKPLPLVMDMIIHAAAINGTKNFYSTPAQVLDVQLQGTSNTLAYARQSVAHTFVLFSSSEVYQTPPRYPTPENVPMSVPDITNPRYSYAVGKIAAEALLQANRSSFKRIITLRPHNIYGPGMGTDHVIGELVSQVLHQKDSGELALSLQGDGSQTRTFMYIEDCVQAIMRVLTSGESGIYNIGNDVDQEISIRDLALKMSSRYARGRPAASLRTTAMPIGGTDRRCPDNGKIRALGYKQAWSLEAGLDQIMEQGV